MGWFSKPMAYIATVRCYGEAPWLGAKDKYAGYKDGDVQVRAKSWAHAETLALQYPPHDCWSYQVIAIRRLAERIAP